MLPATFAYALRTVLLIVFLPMLAGGPQGQCLLAADPTATPLAAGATIRPEALPFSANELASAGRGLYRWNRDTAITGAGLISNRDAYDRFRWNELEPEQGRYDFSDIDAFLADAQKNGQRAILGLVQPIGPASNGDSRMPTYLTSTRYGTWYKGTFWPDYNNPFVLQRLQAIVAELGKRYGNDSRVAMVQMIHYGAYGEYHVPYDYGTNVPRITAANAALTVGYFQQAFPNARLIAMLTDNSSGVMSIAALSASPRIGWARMSLGCDHQMETVGEIIQKGGPLGVLVRDRWKTAPVMAEMIGNYSQQSCGDIFANTLAQVDDYHISLIGNGNFPSPYDTDPYNDNGTRNTASRWSDTQIGQMVLAGKRAGYRYRIASAKVERAQAGAQWQIATEWQNDGNAPTYDGWQVQYELRATTGELAWSGRSSAALEGMLPGTSSTTDTFTLPSALKPGRYLLSVRITLPGVATPLQLAMAGQQCDGGYSLGTIDLRAAQ